MMSVQLPDREEISLCEAVTAVIYGEARDVRHHHRLVQDVQNKQEFTGFDDVTLIEERVASAEPAPANELTTKTEHLLERLREAAYAGRVKFRAIKEGEDPASGYRDIDPLYFYVKPFFNWSQDVIFHREDESATVWYFVHLDREQFASLLREIGVSVEQNPDPGAPQTLDAEAATDLSDLETRGTGLAGRPTSIQFILPLAQKRLDAGDYPDKITEFSEQVARDFAKGAPNMHHPTPKTLRNNATFSEMWRRRKPRKDPA